MMSILEGLESLGFTNAAVVGDRDGVETVRVRTSRGWVYQRFANPEQVTAWAKKHTPEDS